MLQGVLLVPSHIPPPAVCGALQGGDYSGGGVAASLTRGRGGGAGCVPAALLGGALRYRGGWGGGESTPRVSAPMGGRRFSTLESAASAPRRAAVQHPGERRVRHPWERCPAGWGLPPGAAGSVSFPPPPQIPSPVSLSPPGWVWGAAASPPPALPQDGARRGKVVCQAAL